MIVDEDVDVDYEWFAAEVNSGYSNHQALHGLDGWNPDGGYPYMITIHDGEVVQIWKVPLG